MQDVLVLGDWFVDENWVTRPSRAERSSVEGGEHTEVCGGPEHRVLAFCGAGRVARHLYWLGRANKETEAIEHSGKAPFRVFGLGLWSPVDGCRLFKLFHPRYGNRVNPFALTASVSEGEDDLVRELQELHLETLARAMTPATRATTRVVRNFVVEGNRVVVDRRSDFEVKKEKWSYDNEKLQKVVEDLVAARSDAEAFARLPTRYYKAFQLHAEHDALLEETSFRTREAPSSWTSARGTDGPFPTVVVVDHGHGTLRPDLVHALVIGGAVAAGTRWYVTTKDPDGAWLQDLAQQRDAGMLRLVCTHPKASRDARTRWFVPCVRHPLADRGGARLTRDGRQWLDRAPWREAELRVALLEHGAVAAVHGGTEIAAGDPAIAEDLRELVGYASTFFARLVARCIEARSIEDRAVWSWLVEARKEADSYVRNVVGHFVDIADDRESSGPSVGIDTQWPGSPPTPDPKGHLWTEKGPLLVLEKGGISGDPIALWRASELVPGYVALDRNKQEGVRALLEGVRRFAGTRPARRKTWAAMISAPPGAGKSSLVHGLAAVSGMRHHEINITQLLDRAALLRCLQRIATLQDAGSPLMIFVDEINATIDGNPVYDVFLSVLEGGTYGTADDVHLLRPAIWLFAGTEGLREGPVLATLPDGPRAADQSGERLAAMLSAQVESVFRASKERDFRSRIKCHVDLAPQDRDAALAELFYVALHILHASGRRSVPKQALERIWDELGKASALPSPRELREQLDEWTKAATGGPLVELQLEPVPE